MHTHRTKYIHTHRHRWSHYTSEQIPTVCQPRWHIHTYIHTYKTKRTKTGLTLKILRSIAGFAGPRQIFSCSASLSALATLRDVLQNSRKSMHDDGDMISLHCIITEPLQARKDLLRSALQMIATHVTVFQRWCICEPHLCGGSRTLPGQIFAACARLALHTLDVSVPSSIAGSAQALTHTTTLCAGFANVPGQDSASIRRTSALYVLARAAHRAPAWSALRILGSHCPVTNGPDLPSGASSCWAIQANAIGRGEQTVTRWPVLVVPAATYKARYAFCILFTSSITWWAVVSLDQRAKKHFFENQVRESGVAVVRMTHSVLKRSWENICLPRAQ